MATATVKHPRKLEVSGVNGKMKWEDVNTPFVIYIG